MASTCLANMGFPYHTGLSCFSQFYSILHVNRAFAVGFWNIATAWAALPTPFLLRLWLPDGVCDRNQEPCVTTHLETGPSSPLHGNTRWGTQLPSLSFSLCQQLHLAKTGNDLPQSACSEFFIFRAAVPGASPSCLGGLVWPLIHVLSE